MSVARRELNVGGAPLKLRAKVFDLLTVLVERRDRVVSKDELLEHIWPNRYISETTLASCLKELRKALGDTGKEKKLIKTIHGKGFRFIASLDDPAASGDQVEEDLPFVAAAQLAPAAAVAESAFAQPVLTEPLADCLAKSSEPAAPTSERKNVTALRCGLVAAAELTARLDPEALHYLVQDLFALAQSVITRFGGQVTQWQNDGFVALFGVPIAHEDHARRALLAAFELSDLSRRLSREHNALVSVGLCSGTAIVSRLPGNPQQCHTALSRVMQLAGELQRRARVGQVLISVDSYSLLRADVRVRPLEGCSNALRVDHVMAHRAGVPRRFRRSMAPMIGRCQELNLLCQRLTQTAEGHGNAVAIVGNPGIGKSRLLSEFRQHRSDQDIRFFQVNCFPHLHGSPFYPLADLLRQCCDICDDEGLTAVEGKLRAALNAADLGQPEALPLLLSLLELPHDPAPLDPFGARAQRDKTSWFLQRLLLSGEQTTVIALEDLHWMDASSRAWLDGLIRQLVNRPVLLIATYRPGTAVEWLELPWVSQLALSPLAQKHCLRLLDALPRTAPLQDRLPELAELSGGNPFFLEELALNAASARQSIPNTVQGVIAARIDQLPAADKKLLLVAAIIGQRGPLRLLTAVSGLDTQKVECSLLRLLRAELLCSDFAGGDPMFAFKHALVQKVAYNHQLRDQRQSMHAKLASALQQDFPELHTRCPELLAFHYGEAGGHEEAVAYWQRAGRRDCQCSAYAETIDYVNNDLALLDSASQNDRWQTPAGLPESRTAVGCIMRCACAGHGDGF